MDEREVEQVFRAGLEAKARDAEVTAPVVARARAEVSRRRRTRRIVGTAAAAAVVLVVVGTAVATSGDERSTTEPPVVSDPATATLPPDDGLRTEYWGAVAVDVPAEWGYGGAPLASGRESVACYPVAMVGPGGQRVEGRPSAESLGWVGRPIAVTDVCAVYPWIEHSPQEEPSAPYVWLGAAVEPGLVRYDNGFVQETVEAEDTTVTVGSDDADLRAAILESVRPGHLCAQALPHVPQPRVGVSAERRSKLVRAEVCAYRVDPRAGSSSFLLSYAAELDPADAEAAFAAAEAAPRAEVDCDYQPTEFVVLHATYNDEFPNDVIDRAAVFETGCDGSVTLGDGTVRALTAEAVAAWASNGIPAVVYGPTGGKGAMIDSFIGPQG